MSARERRTVTAHKRRPALLLAAVVAGATAAVVIAALVISGSGAPSTPPPPPTKAEIKRIMAAYAEQVSANRAVSRPEIWRGVEFKRFVTAEEAPAVLNECIREFGITTVEMSSNGSLTGELGDDERAVVDACSVSYPYEFMEAGVQTDAQLEYSYNYATTFLVPCLRAAGYTAESPPTSEDYFDTAHASLWIWSPYDTLNFASDRRWSNYRYDSPELIAGEELLHQRCPPDPAGMEPEY
jgi:hypothetical protein